MSSVITDKLYLGTDETHGSLLYDVNSNELLKERELTNDAAWNGGDLLYSALLNSVRLNSILKGRLKSIHLEPTDEEVESNHIEKLVLKNNQVYVSFKDGTNYILSEDLEILSKFRLGIILDVTDSDVPFYFIEKNRTEYMFYLGQDFITAIHREDLSSYDPPVALLTTSTSGVILLKRGLLFFNLDPEVITDFLSINFAQSNEALDRDKMFLIRDQVYIVHRTFGSDANKTYIYEVASDPRAVTSYTIYRFSLTFFATDRYIILFDFLPNVAYVWDTVTKKEIPVELYSKNYVDETKVKIIPSLNNYFPKELSKEITSYIYSPKQSGIFKKPVEIYAEQNRRGGIPPPYGRLAGRTDSTIFTPMNLSKPTLEYLLRGAGFKLERFPGEPEPESPNEIIELEEVD